MSKREMKELAKKLAWVSDEMNDKEKHYRRSEFENQLVKQEYDEVVMEIIQSGYNVDSIIAYMNEYKTLTFAEYHEWLERD